jgi:hypothetical protein
MDKVHKPCNSEYYTPSSQPFRIHFDDINMLVFLILAEMPSWQLTFYYTGKAFLHSPGYAFWWAVTTPEMQTQIVWSLSNLLHLMDLPTHYVLSLTAQGISYSTTRFTSHWQTRASIESTQDVLHRYPGTIWIFYSTDFWMPDKYTVSLK